MGNGLYASKYSNDQVVGQKTTRETKNQQQLECFSLD